MTPTPLPVLRYRLEIVMHEEDGGHWAEVNGFRYSAAADDLPTLLRLIAESIDHLLEVEIHAP